MVGIKWYVIWITWLIRILMPYMILSLIISLIAIINMQPRIKDNPSLTTKAIFKSTNFMVGFSVLFIYSIQTAFLILLFGQIFSKSIFIFWLFFYFNIFLNKIFNLAFIAKVFAIFFWLATGIDFTYNLGIGAKYFLCFMPNVGLKLCFHVINQYERSCNKFSTFFFKF